jgi:hypothetical protein
MKLIRLLPALVMILGSGGLCVAQPAALFWLPDEATVKAIEATLPPVDGYARYYTGWTEKGHRIIAGDFESGRQTKDKPGIYIVQYGDVRTLRTEGGCEHMVLRYDVDAQKVTLFRCNGLR